MLKPMSTLITCHVHVNLFQKTKLQKTIHDSFVYMIKGASQTTVVILEGKELVYTCNQTRYPENEVYWTKNNSGIVLHGELLNLTNIQRTESGVYLCEANHDPGNEIEILEVIYVDVQCE